MDAGCGFFGIDEKTAIRYANSARQLLDLVPRTTGAKCCGTSA
ncbi:hypothetical protein ACFV8T_36020 [Streptomyces sp. NPDC059832]